MKKIILFFTVFCFLRLSSIYALEDVNLALGKTVSANSGNNAPAAVDGDESTYWSSARQSGNYLCVDLGSRYLISKIVLKWKDQYFARSITLRYSDAGIINSTTGNTIAISPSEYNDSGEGPVTDVFGTDQPAPYRFEAFTARYIAFQTRGRNNTAPYNGDHYELKEIEIYGAKEFVDPVRQEAIDTITARLVNKHLKDYTNDTNATAYFNSMQADGSWSNIDYNDKVSLGGWAPATHLSYLTAMAIAFRSPAGIWYEKPEMREKIEKGLLFYQTKDPQANDNWWYTDIGDPQKYMIPALLLKGYSTSETIDQITAYLRDLTDKSSVEGQNLAWCAEIVTYKGCAENSYELTLKAFNAMAATLKIASTQGIEGIKIDGSFHQHHAQIYSGGYGLSITDYLSASMELSAGTMFSEVYTPQKLEIFRNMLLNGHQLLGYRSVMDFGTLGRNISRSGSGRNISSTVLDRMISGDPEKAAEYQAWKEHLSGAAFPVPGNKHFWKSDIMTHHGTDYYLSAKIISARTYGTECLNQENLLGYNLPLGTTNILTTGTEYYGIYPLWDWTKLPGTTSAQEAAATAMPADTYLIGSNPFGGGVSSSVSGVMAYEHDYKGLNAFKAYFMLGDAMVCLGTNINLNKQVEVATSVNQCFLNGDVIVSHGGITETIGSQTANSYQDLNWIHHDNIGYIFPDNADVTVKNQRQQGSWSLINATGSSAVIRNYVFSAHISHGSSPENGQYQYIVVPGKTADDFRVYAFNHGYVTVRNDNAVQAVRNDRIGKAGIVFHAAGSVDLGNGLTIASDKPLLALIEQGGATYSLSVADPNYKETSVQLTINKQLVGANVTSATADRTVLTINLPTGDYQGSTVTNSYTDVNYSSISYPEKNGESVVIYLNPATEMLSVLSASTIQKISVIGLTGSLLGTHSLQADRYLLSTASWPQGIYLMKIETEKTVLTRKIIK